MNLESRIGALLLTMQLVSCNLVIDCSELLFCKYAHNYASHLRKETYKEEKYHKLTTNSIYSVISDVTFNKRWNVNYIYVFQNTCIF